MKKVKYLIILISIIVLSWVLPKSSQLMRDNALPNNMVYYSSVEHSFVSLYRDSKKNNLVRKNSRSGKIYSNSEFDSILPLLYYRQLVVDRKMPKEICGKKILLGDLQSKSFFYHMSPTKKNTPKIKLYTMFESNSGRVRLKMPLDFFRLTNKIEFINAEDNSVNIPKSEMFQNLFDINDFKFPAVLTATNPNPKKAYDEGSFILDSENHLFHLKMMNSKPFLKKINMPKDLHPVYISILEPLDHSFYAFVYGKYGKVYQLTTDNYRFQEIDCPKYDINKDKLKIMANPFFWTLSVINKDTKISYALLASNKKVIDKDTINFKGEYNHIENYTFPFVLSFESDYSNFLYPSFIINSYINILVNLFFLLIFIVILKIKKREMAIVPIVLILFTGIYGLISILIFEE